MCTHDIDDHVHYTNDLMAGLRGSPSLIVCVCTWEFNAYNVHIYT